MDTTITNLNGVTRTEEKAARVSNSGMVNAIKIMLLSLACALLIWLNFKPAPQWEYQIISVPDTNFESGINALGLEGWELVTARRASSGDTNNLKPSDFSYEMIFKRPKARTSALMPKLVTQ